MNAEYTEIDWQRVGATYNDECGTNYNSRILAKIWRDISDSAITAKLNQIIARGGYYRVSFKKMHEALKPTKYTRTQVRTAYELYHLIKPMMGD